MTATDTGYTARLWALLPAVYRARDAELRIDPDGPGPLQALVGVLGRQLEVLGAELDQLYDDQFIETCADWVVTYIGETIGYRPINTRTGVGQSPRSEVANTIKLRRSKGTAWMLQKLARDVTGWPARSTESFQHIVGTQFLNHVRAGAQATVGLRDPEALEWITSLGGAFDDLAHTVDVRRVDAPQPGLRGRYNVPDIGIFLFRVLPVTLPQTPLTPDPSNDGRRFRFDQLGVDRPLYAAYDSARATDTLATPDDVPLPLGRRRTARLLAEHYGPTLDLDLGTVAADGTDLRPVPIDDIVIADLDDEPGSPGVWAHDPNTYPDDPRHPGRPLPADAVAVDPVLGRVWWRTAPPAGRVPVATFRHGQAVPLGARAGTVAETVQSPRVDASAGQSLQPLLDQAAAGGTVRIMDSWRYRDPVVIAATGGAAAPTSVVANTSTRPVLWADGDGVVRLAPGPGSTIELHGLLIAGPVVLDEVDDEEQRTVVLQDCTLVPGLRRSTDGSAAVPGAASLIVLDPNAIVTLDSCELGPIVAVDGATVALTECVVDAGDATLPAYCGRAATTDGSGDPVLRAVTSSADLQVGTGGDAGGAITADDTTIVGTVHAVQVDASNAILFGTVTARRRQVGCLRYSWLPTASRVGQRFSCLPEDPADEAAVTPWFTSLDFGDPTYAQLRVDTAREVRTGSDDATEPGATHVLAASLREDNLRVRLTEYLRFGLEAGVFYAN